MSDDGRNQALRVRLVLLIGLALLAALGSYWVLELMHKDELSKPQAKQGEPDYEVENFHFVRTAVNGKAHYLLSGSKLVHHPADDSILITAPVAQSISVNQAPVTIVADIAHLTDDNQHVQLNGHVRITRPGNDKADPLLIQAPSLMVMTESDTMQTPDPVDITMGKSTLHGVGMSADNATGVFQLLHNVHGTLAPHKK